MAQTGFPVTKTASVRQDLCRGCGLCTTVCPTGAIELRSGKARVWQDRCKGCLVCAGSCPARAIVAMPLDSLAETVRRMGKLQEDIRRLSIQVKRLQAGKQTSRSS